MAFVIGGGLGTRPGKGRPDLRKRDGRQVVVSVLKDVKRSFLLRQVNKDFDQVRPQKERVGEPVKARVVDVRPVCSSRYGNHMQITVDSKELNWTHKKPGQFVLVNRVGQDLSSVLVVASPPESERLQFLVDSKHDEGRLSKIMAGEVLQLSTVIGDGLSVEPTVSGPRLLMFVDCAQGAAAMRSFATWSHFRVASGSGTNRKVQVKIYMYFRSPSQPPFLNEFRDWRIYGVDVVPVFEPFLDYLRLNPLDTSTIETESVIACMSNEKDKEWLFRYLHGLGVQRENMQHITEHSVSRELEVFQVGRAQEPACVGEEECADLAFDEWQSTRNYMHLDRRMHMGAVSEGFQKKVGSFSKEEWDNWIADNSDWDIPGWDDEEWAGYWNLWQKDRLQWREKGFNQEWFVPEGEFKTRSRSTHWHWQRSARGFGGGQGDRFSGSSDSQNKYADIDSYRILGIEDGADLRTVKKAYRAMAMKFHPDLNPNIGEAGLERMQMIALAYAQIRDTFRM
uniref:J domain-containing protein n=2 Tax=Rhodosorus marinus TaxID=101924 RepID=A0A7S3A342_9RHOD|mmetsp:Transcript_43020/g.168373  ORF Transcript_43020/g.168373 Transcript_43020/m.168373 type:complete len:509 (+) Transcript_43020:102-1628(+)